MEIKELITEELTKTDVNGMIDTKLTADKLKSVVSKIVMDMVKNGPLEDQVVEITTNVITQLFKTLWVKRGNWRNNLSNKAN